MKVMKLAVNNHYMNISFELNIEGISPKEPNKIGYILVLYALCT